MFDLGDLREAKGRAEGKAEVAYKYYKEHHDLREALDLAGISKEDLLKVYPELKDELK